MSDMMKQYSLRGMTRPERILNYRLSRARRVVENTFGILANRFQVLLSMMQQQPDTVKLIFTACMLLHNLIRFQVLLSTMQQQSSDRCRSLCCASCVLHAPFMCGPFVSRASHMLCIRWIFLTCALCLRSACALYATSALATRCACVVNSIASPKFGQKLDAQRRTGLIFSFFYARTVCRVCVTGPYACTKIPTHTTNDDECIALVQRARRTSSAW